MALILSTAHIWRREDWVHGGGFVERNAVTAIAVGTPWPEIRAKLGAPGDAARAAQQ